MQLQLTFCSCSEQGLCLLYVRLRVAASCRCSSVVNVGLAGIARCVSLARCGRCCFACSPCCLLTLLILGCCRLQRCTSHASERTLQVCYGSAAAAIPLIGSVVDALATAISTVLDQQPAARGLALSDLTFHRRFPCCTVHISGATTRQVTSIVETPVAPKHTQISQSWPMMFPGVPLTCSEDPGSSWRACAGGLHFQPCALQLREGSTPHRPGHRQHGGGGSGRARADAASCAGGGRGSSTQASQGEAWVWWPLMIHLAAVQIAYGGSTGSCGLAAELT